MPEPPVTKLVYKILQHDGGWAYEADGTISETFASHDEAFEAARRAADVQAEPTDPGDPPEVSVQDS
jgi:hypothetical protein